MFTEDLLRSFSKRRTPFYYYDQELLVKTLKSANQAAAPYGYRIHYALKANSDDRILNTISSMGYGADCVSGNEVIKAYQSGFPSSSIVFAGVGKSDHEIIAALDIGIACFNCESIQEIEVINDLAKGMNKVAPIALRLNPNVDAKTHHYITTGLEENKFGINLWELDDVLARLKSLTSIELIGIHFHIGSQIMDLNPFRSLCIKVNEILDRFRSKNISLREVNVGGGFGIDYHAPDVNPIPDFKAYFDVFHKFLKPDPSMKIHFELGRSLVAQCGSLISRVLYVKNGVTTNFAILDAGMTELIRPALYQSYHKIENISRQGEASSFKYDVVGPVCESSDCFGKAMMLPLTERGDLIAIRSAGAYGEVMASHYNLRKLNPSFYSDEITHA